MSAFNIEERTFLDLRYGGSSPANIEVALSTTSPNDDGTGITEPSGFGYSRIVVANSAVNWPAATTIAGTTTKKNGIAFTFPTATGSWGTITHWWLWDPTALERMIYGPLSSSILVGLGDTLRIPLGGLVITLD